MKWLLTTILFLMVTYMNGQIQKIEVAQRTPVGKVKMMGTLRASLEYKVEDGDTIYILTYKNDKYSRIASYESIMFSETGGTAEALYQMLRDAAKAEKGTKSALKLGEEVITLFTDRTSGMKYVAVMTEKGYFNIMPGEIDKLFGKK